MLYNEITDTLQPKYINKEIRYYYNLVFRMTRHGQFGYTMEIRKTHIEEKLLKLDSKIAFLKIINTKNFLKMRNIGKSLFKVKVRWIKKEEPHENRGCND